MKLTLLIPLVAAFLLAQHWHTARAWLEGGLDYDPATDGEVVLYATASCGYCRKTRHFLRVAGVPFTERDIERSAEAGRRFRELGGVGVPLLQIGDELVHGYDPGAIRAAFED